MKRASRHRARSANITISISLPSPRFRRIHLAAWETRRVFFYLDRWHVLARPHQIMAPPISRGDFRKLAVPVGTRTRLLRRRRRQIHRGQSLLRPQVRHLNPPMCGPLGRPTINPSATPVRTGRRGQSVRCLAISLARSTVETYPR
jgi:hypothetical protein